MQQMVDSVLLANDVPAPKTVQKVDVDPNVSTRPWTDDIIYMLMVDRFHNGDPSNDGTSPARHGGDLQGVIDKLDYLQDLGVTALWIDPVEQNQPDGYHGYWPTDFDEVDPHRGTLDKLVELREEANKRGIKLILDRVINHTGYEHEWAKDPAKKDWFHDGRGMWGMSREALEHGSLHGLPDLKQENPEVAGWLIESNRDWLKKTGAQGYRLDAVKHVDFDFWSKYSAAMKAEGGQNFLLLGEVYRGVPEYVANYQNNAGLDSCFDVPLADAVRNTFTHDSEEDGPGLLSRAWDVWKNRKHLLFNEAMRKLGGSGVGDMRNLSEVFEQDKAYSHPELLATIIDNHDVSRFLTEAGDKGEAKLKLALALTFTARGIPTVLYGTEAGMKGQAGTRDDMQFGANPELESYFKQLTSLRRENVELRRGEQNELFADREVYAFSRVHPEGTSHVALNNSRQTQLRKLPGKPGQEAVNLLTGDRYIANARGEFPVLLAPNQAVVLKLEG